MKKIISVVGARPNFMKVAPIDRALQEFKDEYEHIIVHTGQHYDSKMSDAFFQDLDMPEPKYFLNVGSASHAVQTAKIMVEFEQVLLNEKPDLVIVVGDVNSTIACALTTVKMGIKTAHVEAGLRSYDRDMPEEINRIATDSICDFFFVTEESGFENLLDFGISEEQIFYVGNTMIDSLHYALPKTASSTILNDLNISSGNYSLVTVHRPSNVDNKEQIEMFFDIFDKISENLDIVFPVHPRTLKNIENFGLKEKLESNKRIRVIEPLGYIDFLNLMKNSALIITDSGGIQEETTALSVPCFTLRTSTERPITIEIGTNVLINPIKSEILKHLDTFFANNIKKGKVPELWDGKAAERIITVLQSILK